MSLGRIRDPVHGYVVFTAIERALLDHPIAQRLRHVSQSAAAHFVFPEMRVSRFAHSLGAMHLASRFFAAAMANARPRERELILRGCHDVVDRHKQLGLGSTDDRLLDELGLRTGRDLPASDRVAVMLVEQGLRLASLVHDLGHLPFSHDFESALEDHLRTTRSRHAETLLAQGPGGDKPHERIGYALARVVQVEVFNTSLEGTALAKPAEVSLKIAEEILNAPAAPELDAPGEAAVLDWLHSLVAGELDVDRADYVLRDNRHYGLTAAGYDLDRLIDNLTPAAVSGGRLVTAVLPQGVSAAESLSVARFRMYAWAIYHHKVQQVAAGLQVAIGDALAHGGRDTERFVDDIAAIADGSASAESVSRFAEYDDVWWVNLLRGRLRDGIPGNIEPWLALFVQRRPGPKSLWKRPTDFPVEDRAGWNRRLPGKGDITLSANWAHLRREFADEGVLLVRLGFNPWSAGPDGHSELQILTADGLQPLTRLSPLTYALADAWAGELQVMAFATTAEHPGPHAIIERLEPALRSEEH